MSTAKDITPNAPTFTEGEGGVITGEYAGYEFTATPEGDGIYTVEVGEDTFQVQQIEEADISNYPEDSLYQIGDQWFTEVNY